MNTKHQSAIRQELDGGARGWRLENLQRLRVRRTGWLTVSQGQVWLTRDGDDVDHVLGAGEPLRLHRGESVIVEPWHARQGAGLRWQQDAPAAQARGLRGRATWALEAGLRAAAGLLRGAAGRLLLAARSAEAMANRAHGSISAGDSIACSGALQ